MRDSAWWERHGRDLPSSGIRAQTRRGSFGKSWWASRWIAALERLVNPARLARGRSYARTGHVISLDVGPGTVAAVVQGTRPKPYSVNVEFKRLSDADWDRVVDAMSSEALYAARLLSGEMPEQIEDVFAGVGTSLFPAAEGDMRTRCSCPDLANPCKHIAAVHYLLGERFDADPFLMFLLRGRSQDQIVTMLRARRSVGEDEPAAGEADALAEPALTTFWCAPPQAAEVALHFAVPETDALPVKGLGALPFGREQQTRATTQAMERLYREIAEYALLLALGDSEPVTLPGPAAGRDREIARRPPA